MPWPRLTFIPEAKERAGLTERERRYADDNDLKFWTNFALLTAVIAGLVVAACHQGVITASITAFAGALGLGGVLGFLFGVPSPTAPGSSDNVETATITTGDQSIVKIEAPPPVVAAPAVAPQPEAEAQVVQAPAGIVPLNNAPNPANAAPSKSTPSPQPKADSSARSSPPSNLEQVADWVTKLLLGGGLTQISKIAPKVWQWSYAVAISISRNDATPAAPALIASNQAFAAGLMVYGFILGFFGGFLITKIQLGKAISN